MKNIMERQHIVCLIAGLACVGLATPVALLTGSPAVLVLVAAGVALRLHTQLHAGGIATRHQPAPVVPPTRKRRAGG